MTPFKNVINDQRLWATILITVDLVFESRPLPVSIQAQQKPCVTWMRH